MTLRFAFSELVAGAARQCKSKSCAQQTGFKTVAQASCNDQRDDWPGYEEQNNGRDNQWQNVVHDLSPSRFFPFLNQQEAEQHATEVREIGDAGRAAA